MQLNIEQRLAERARNLQPSPIRELFPYLAIDGMISLGGGYPNPTTFPLEEVAAQIPGDGAFTMEGRMLEEACQYGPSDIHSSLQSKIPKWHQFKDNVKLEGQSFLTLNGAQEGLFLMAYLFLEENDSVVVSEPTYPGGLSAFRTFTNKFHSIPLDADGMDTTILKKHLQEMADKGEKLPKFIYTIPCGHNPGGVSLSSARRRTMLEIATRFDLLVLEDDPYQLIRFDRPRRQAPTLQSLDKNGRVIRLDSFSKIFAPGLRIGYLSASPAIVRHFLLVKQALNLHTSSFTQALLARCLEVWGLPEFMKRIEKNCGFYLRNRDIMVEAAKEYLPAEVAYNIPHEGFFIWFRLPRRCNTRKMMERDARELKVVLVPGPGFSASGGLDHCMRASFATATPDDITEGMNRFGAMVRNELEQGNG